MSRLRLIGSCGAWCIGPKSVTITLSLKCPRCHRSKLHSEGKLDRLPWTCVAAAPTYNPLGCTVTFLSAEDIVNAALKLHKPQQR